MQWQANLSPEDFERAVQESIRKSGASLSDFQVARREYLSAADGTYEIDVTARFRALEVDFLVLIECKHHRSPIKREVVQILNDRVRSLGAHKAMLFSTSRFQTGAAKYAQVHGIALIQVVDGQLVYQTRSRFQPPMLPPGTPRYATTLARYGETPDGQETVFYRTLDRGDVNLILESFHRSGPSSEGA